MTTDFHYLPSEKSGLDSVRRYTGKLDAIEPVVYIFQGGDCMSGVMYVLLEEQKRLGDLVAFYEKKMATLAPGRIALRGRGRAYAYHVYSDQGKERQVYLGRCSSDKVVQIQEEICRRGVYEKRIREAKAEAKLIGKMLRVR